MSFIITAGQVSDYTGAAHHNPILKAFAKRLRDAGKPHKVIITAVARKLVTIAKALCKKHKTGVLQGA